MQAAPTRNGADKHAAQRRNLMQYIDQHVAELQRNKNMGELNVKITMLRGGNIADEADIEYTAKFRFKQAVTKEPTQAG